MTRYPGMIAVSVAVGRCLRPALVVLRMEPLRVSTIRRPSLSQNAGLNFFGGVGPWRAVRLTQAGDAR